MLLVGILVTTFGFSWLINVAIRSSPSC